MPHNPIDYSKSIIYTIRCLEDPKLLYVGSTTSFVDRKRQHKSKCKSETQKLYKMIQENKGWDNFVMVEHCVFPCANSTELRQEEERVRLELQSKLNTNKCFTTKEDTKIMNNEWTKEYNKEHIDEKKQYNIDNKEHRAEVKKKWDNDNKEHIKQYNKDNIEQTKKYVD